MTDHVGLGPAEQTDPDGQAAERPAEQGGSLGLPQADRHPRAIGPQQRVAFHARKMVGIACHETPGPGGQAVGRRPIGRTAARR